MSKKIRYVCSYCGKKFILANQFRTHANRDHHWDDHQERPVAEKEMVQVDHGG